MSEWHAPPHWAQIDFISDLHLAPALPHTLAGITQYLSQTTADAVVILGDLFDVWVGDDARHDAFERHCTEVLRQASTRRVLAFMVGNRDFFLGAQMHQATGMKTLPDPTVMVAWGQRTLLTHGDAWCLDDIDYQTFRAQVRTPAWQSAFLGQPLTQRREHARAIRAESKRRKAALAPEVYADVDTATALQWLRRTASTVLVHGHTHRPASHTLAAGTTRHVLSDWDLDDPCHPRAEVLQWRPGGWQRVPYKPL